MTPYRLADVLGAMVAAVTEAQYISDRYTDLLYSIYRDDPQLDALAIPNTEIRRVRLHMSFAIADVTVAERGQRGRDDARRDDSTPIPNITVYVNATDLSEIPEKDISTLDITLAIRDVEALPPDPEAPPPVDQPLEDE